MGGEGASPAPSRWERAGGEGAYRRFILDLYQARPIDGQTWIHGIKGNRLVHVGSVDAVISLSDVVAIAGEYRHAVDGGGSTSDVSDVSFEPETRNQKPETPDGIDVLGWDFADDLPEAVRQSAALAGIDVRFRRIPPEVMDDRAVSQSDVRFFGPAAMAVEVAADGHSVTVTLADFAMPPENVPAGVRRAITSWPQWIDSWAVDWDHRGGAFHDDWWAFRTRQGRDLPLTAAHTYADPGVYTVAVRVVDVLGNETTRRFAPLRAAAPP